MKGTTIAIPKCSTLLRLSEDERIPTGQHHIVTEIPRKATEHIPMAFRHEIVLKDDFFLKHWNDRSSEL
jgi:hypothetical protein